MTERRMSCSKCPRYDREALRCREGKSNPGRKSDAVAVSELLGLRSLCQYSPYRERLAVQSYFPKSALASATSARRTRRPSTCVLTVEIIEEPKELVAE
jgi:hypothetical protein